MYSEDSVQPAYPQTFPGHMTKCANSRRAVQQTVIRARGYKIFSYSTQLSMKFFLPINVKISSKNSILGLSEPEKC